MNKDELNEKIYAAALGCLDKKESLLFKKSISSLPDFPDKNFGIYQQLTSLLPLILDRVEPDKSIKDRIARKVYRLKDETTDVFVDTIVKKESPTTNPVTEKITIRHKEPETSDKQDEIKEEPKIINTVMKSAADVDRKKEEKPQPITERFEKINTLADDNIKDDIVLTQRKLDIPIEDKKPKRNHDKNEPVKYEQMLPIPETALSEDPAKKNKFFIILLILISATSMIGSAFVYIKYSSDNDKYIQQINSLNHQINKLNEEAAANKNLLSVVESGGFKVIRMNSLQEDSISLVRVLLNSTTNSGFLQTRFSEVLAGNQSLKLWGILDGEKKLLVTFSGSNENKFYPINLSAGETSSEIILVITNTNAISDSLLFSGIFRNTQD